MTSPSAAHTIDDILEACEQAFGLPGNSIIGHHWNSRWSYARWSAAVIIRRLHPEMDVKDIGRVLGDNSVNRASNVRRYFRRASEAHETAYPGFTEGFLKSLRILKERSQSSAPSI